MINTLLVFLIAKNSYSKTIIKIFKKQKILRFLP